MKTKFLRITATHYEHGKAYTSNSYINIDEIVSIEEHVKYESVSCTITLKNSKIFVTYFRSSAIIQEILKIQSED